MYALGLGCRIWLHSTHAVWESHRRSLYGNATKQLVTPWIKSTRIDSTWFNWTLSVPATLRAPLSFSFGSLVEQRLPRGWNEERQTNVCGSKEFSWNHFSSCTVPTFYIMFHLQCALPYSFLFWNTNYAQDRNTFSYSLAVIQGVSCLFTAEAWLRSEKSPCGICGGSGFGTGFLASTSPFTSESFHKSLY